MPGAAGFLQMRRSARDSKRCDSAGNNMTPKKLVGVPTAILIGLVAAAVIIPGMRPPGIAANEASAIAATKTINTAEVSYRATYGVYASSLANLGGPEPCIKSAVTACLLDEKLASGVKFGYKFAATGRNPANGANTAFVVG